MNHSEAAKLIHPYRAPGWRAVLVVSAALMLGACHGPQQSGVPTDGASGYSPALFHPPALPQASAASPSAAVSQPYAMSQSPALPQTAGYASNTGEVTPTAAYAEVPPGPSPQGPAAPGVAEMGPVPAPVPFCPACPGPLESPQPYGVPAARTNEYLCDGGDSGLRVAVTSQGRIVGLDPEDTVASFKTADGRTLVEASNQVCIYSPRFAAVRQVVGLFANEQLDRTAGVSLPTGVRQEADLQILRTNKQNIQANRDVGSSSLTIYRTRVGESEVSRTLGPRGFQSGFLPYENFAIIRLGMFQEAEMARLAKGVNAAIAWTGRQSVHVILDEQRTAEEVSDQMVGTVYGTGVVPTHPRLRVVKVASTHFAEPGDTVDFTVRFDNLGTQPIRNVTILDNLSLRLEYVDQSAQCSVAAQFGTEVGESGTQVIRCELSDPLLPGQGGVLRFRCLVR